MYPLGQLGIGTWIVPARIRDSLSWPWFAFGCLLPDVVDKPIFVAARLMRHAGPINLAVLHSSRLFGHVICWAKQSVRHCLHCIPLAGGAQTPFVDPPRPRR